MPSLNNTPVGQKKNLIGHRMVQTGLQLVTFLFPSLSLPLFSLQIYVLCVISLCTSTPVHIPSINLIFSFWRSRTELFFRCSFKSDTEIVSCTISDIVNRLWRGDGRSLLSFRAISRQLLKSFYFRNRFSRKKQEKKGKIAEENGNENLKMSRNSP